MWRRVSSMYLLMSGSLNDFVSSSGYAGSNGTILNEWRLAGRVEGNSSGETEVKHDKPLKITECPGWASNQAPSEWKLEKKQIRKSSSATPCSLVDTHSAEPTNSIFIVEESSTLMMEQQVDIYKCFGGNCCLLLRGKWFSYIMVPSKRW
jgi:hypothetical protein